MAQVTFSISSAPLTASKIFNGTDQDMQNIITWAGVAYRGIIDELFNPSHNPAFNRQCTNRRSFNDRHNASVATGRTKFRNDGNVAAVPPPPANTFQ